MLSENALSKLVGELVEDRLHAMLGQVEGGEYDGYEAWWMPRYLDFLSECGGNASLAWRRFKEADDSAPSRSTVYTARHRCTRFGDEWDRLVATATVLKGGG